MNEIYSGEDYEDRYWRILEELGQIGGELFDDEIEISEEALDDGFAEYLLKNPGDLKILRSFVGTIKSDGLEKKAWDGFKTLERFLNNIWGDDSGEIGEKNSEKSKKIFYKFFDRLNNKLKDLHKMKDKDVKTLNAYLLSDQEDAMLAYESMKAILDDHQNFFGTGMKLDDVNVFQAVWNSLKNNYQNNETFIEAEYPGYSTLSDSATSIQSFLMTNKWIISWPWLEWEWDEITVAHLENKLNSIISREAIVTKLNELNNQRVAKNKSLVEAVDINIPTADFTRTAEWGLKFKWTEFSANDVMMYSDEISAAVNGGDFVNDKEKWRTINECRNSLYEKFKAKLLADPSVAQEGNQDNNPDSWEWESGQNEYLAGNDIIKIKNTKLKQQVVNLRFCDSLEWDSVKFNIIEVKTYLDGLKDKKWNDLNSQDKLDKETWIIAVQIALNYLNSKEWNYKNKCSVEWLDWIRWPKTIKWVKWFQKIAGIKEDGAPWSQTITKLVEALWWVENGWIKVGEINGVRVKEWEKEVPKDREVAAEDLVEAPDWATVQIDGNGVDKAKEWEEQEVTVIVKLGDKEQKVTVIVIIKNGEIKTEEKKDDEKRAENEGKNEEQKGLEDVNVKQEIALPENGKEVDARDLVEIPEEAIKWDEEITVGFKDEKWIDLESEDEQEVTVVAKLWDEEKEITIIVSVDAENRKIKAKEKK